MLLMFIFKRYKALEIQTQELVSNDNKSDINQMVDQNTDTDSQPMFHTFRAKILLIVLLSISLFFYTGIEMSFFIYSATFFHYLPIHISVQKAADLQTVMTATFTAGRLFSAYVSSKLRPRVMLSYHLCIIGISLCILYFGRDSMTCIWIGDTLIGNHCFKIKTYL